jgi:hypothetical protein
MNSEGGKKKRKSKPAAAPLQSGSFPYHPEEEYIDKVCILLALLHLFDSQIPISILHLLSSSPPSILRREDV